MTRQLSKISQQEWSYLTDEARNMIKQLEIGGVQDLDLALELTLVILGENACYELERD